jgi:hypothetical protein
MKYFGRAEGVARAKIVLPEVKKDGVCAMFPPKSWRGKSWREMRPKAENRASFAPVEIYLGISIEHWPSAGYENCDVLRQASSISILHNSRSHKHKDKSLRRHRTTPAHALLPRRNDLPWITIIHHSIKA